MKPWQIGVIVLVLFAAGVGIYKIASQPTPGTRKDDQGNTHVTPEEMAKFSYNSNPPTSGPHLPTWVKAGVYDTPQSEGELIHSLEHGYVIISYNCNVHLRSSVIPSLSRDLSNSIDYRRDSSARPGVLGRNDILVGKVYAHEEGGEASQGADFVDPTIATGSAVNDSAGCKELIAKLRDFAKANRLWKLIVVPRPQLDTTIALTAWNYIDKFDPPAGGFDEKRIKTFIDYHRDQGPEKTVENPME